MTALSSLRDLFIDPISHEKMTDPVISTCGHTFERSQIDGWMAWNVTLGSVPECPLCRTPLANLVPNVLIKQAIEILDNNPLEDRVEALLEEDRTIVETAAANIEDLRATDRLRGVPDRLAEARSFMGKVATSISNYYRCG